MVMMRRRRKEETWSKNLCEEQRKGCDKPQVSRKMMSHAANFPDFGGVDEVLTKKRGLVLLRSWILGIASSLNTITEIRYKEALSSCRCLVLPDKARASRVERRDRFFVDAYHLSAAGGGRKAFSEVVIDEWIASISLSFLYPSIELVSGVSVLAFVLFTHHCT